MGQRTTGIEWTPRQREVLGLLARGYTDFAIAQELGLSLDSATWHVREVMGKLAVESREEAAAYWHEQERPSGRLRALFAALGSRQGLTRVFIAGLLFGPVVVGIVVTLLIVGGSSDSGPSAATPAATLAAGDATALRQAQDAVDRYASYVITIDQHNLVLPQWGGADSGTVKVAKGGEVAVANLARTGEPGATYAITRIGAQTYFRRSTCNETFRVPGGGGDVLMPFLIGKTKALANAKVTAGDGGIQATIDGIGLVTVEIDSTTHLPVRFSGTHDGQPLNWTFSDWGDATLDVSVPVDAQDRGPGGVPC